MSRFFGVLEMNGDFCLPWSWVRASRVSLLEPLEQALEFSLCDAEQRLE